MTNETDPAGDSRWQRRALDRSLSDARARALARSSRFLSAAMDLLRETGRVDFTVQQIVERSELSLRSFYQHFSGKDELLLALFEELITQFAEDLGREVEGIDDPVERLEAYVRGFLVRADASPRVGGRALTSYHLGLAADQPGDFTKAMSAQLELLGSIVQLGVDRGAFRSDLSVLALTHLLNSTLVSIAQMDVFDVRSVREPVGTDEVWAWCHAAVTG
jgi:AcrR family transcriptional regulator